MNPVRNPLLKWISTGSYIMRKPFEISNGVKEIIPGIIIDPKIRGEKLVIKGTRVPGDLILGKIAGGITSEELIKEYDLKKEDIFVAIDYAVKSNKKYAKNK